MIYFFNNDLELEKVVTSSNVDSAIHEHELNGLIIFNLEIDLEYGKTFIDRVDHVGYYYKDEFYLHKIERVEDLHTEELMHVFGRHIFFNDMVFGRLVEDKGRRTVMHYMYSRTRLIYIHGGKRS